MEGTSLVVQWLRLCSRGTGWIPSQGITILHAMQPDPRGGKKSAGQKADMEKVTWPITARPLGSKSHWGAGVRSHSATGTNSVSNLSRFGVILSHQAFTWEDEPASTLTALWGPGQSAQLAIHSLSPTATVRSYMCVIWSHRVYSGITCYAV